MSDFYHTSIHTSKKEYICENCLSTIDKGTKYIKCVGVFDGDFSDYKSHEDCHCAVNDFYYNYRIDDNYNFLHEYVYDDFNEMMSWLLEDYPQIANRFIEREIKKAKEINDTINKNKTLSPKVSIFEND